MCTGASRRLRDCMRCVSILWTWRGFGVFGNGVSYWATGLVRIECKMSHIMLTYNELKAHASRLPPPSTASSCEREASTEGDAVPGAHRQSGAGATHRGRPGQPAPLDVRAQVRLERCAGQQCKSPHSRSKIEPSKLTILSCTWQLHCKGGALVTVKNTEINKGMKGRRGVSASFDNNNNNTGRQRLRMQYLLQPKKAQTTDSVDRWECDVRGYEQRFGKALDDDVKIGVILSLAPALLQNHYRTTVT